MAMITQEPIFFHGNVFILKTIFTYFHRSLKIDSEFQSSSFIIFDRLIGTYSIDNKQRIQNSNMK